MELFPRAAHGLFYYEIQYLFTTTGSSNKEEHGLKIETFPSSVLLLIKRDGLDLIYI